MLSALFLL